MLGSPRSARRNRHSVTFGHFDLFRLGQPFRRDHEVVARHGDAPYSGRSVTSEIGYLVHHFRDMNRWSSEPFSSCSLVSILFEFCQFIS
jgi:hypothetical protein